MVRGGGNAGKSKGRSREAPSREVLVSKKLAWLLRHGAGSEGVKLGRGGYANLGQVLQSRAIKSLNPAPTLQEINDLVATNAKQRFSLIHITNTPADSSASEEQAGPAATSDAATADLATLLETDADPAHYLIRANQGHSLTLESGTDDLLTPITLEAGNLPNIVVHGTIKEHWSKIVASGGLRPMTRTHVHFATGLPATFKSPFAAEKAAGSSKTAAKGKATDVEAAEVAELPEKKTEAPQILSGMRNTSTVLIFLDLRKALDKGLLFYVSQNGVVLSKGNDEGLIGLDLFERVEDRSGNALVEGGALVEAGHPTTPKLAKDTQHKAGRVADLPIREKAPAGDTAGNT